MKRIITFILVFIIAFMLSINAYAMEEGNETELPDMQDEIPSETVPEGEIDLDTVLTRLHEWWDEYATVIESIVGFIVVSVLGILSKKLKSYIGEIFTKLMALMGRTDEQGNKTNELIKGYNGQTDAITALQDETREMRAKVEETCTKADEALAAMSCVAHILDTVYANSSVLPQGTKDVIHVDYAKCMMLLNHINPEAENGSEATTDEVDSED